MNEQELAKTVERTRAFWSERETAFTDIALIQPADPFLDMAGEDLRRRIFMTESETGKQLCLRPEFTIPMCLLHIQNASKTPMRYSYLGKVFRQHRESGNEFMQGGIEDLGNSDLALADANTMSDALGVVQENLPGHEFNCILGDQAVFENVISELGATSAWATRLVHAFGDQTRLNDLLIQMQKGEDADIQNETFDNSVSEEDLVSIIRKRMVETGYSTHASRSPEEIAQRLIEKRTLQSTTLDKKAIATLQEFLKIDEPLERALAVLEGFAKKNELDLHTSLSVFNARIKALQKAGIDCSKVSYRASFGRSMDYYTGLSFEIFPENDKTILLAGGGRYDRLLTLLGAAEKIPAVGFSIWLDRISAVQNREGL